jgi:HAD superfamily hydrolase (TIGR01549 family)
MKDTLTGASFMSAAPPIRAVLFDVDGTLYHQRRLRLCMAAELAIMPLRLGASSGRVLRVLKTYRRVHEELRHLGAPDSPLAAMQIARTAHREHVGEAMVQAAVSEWMHRRPLKYLRWCRRRGLVALLSRLEQRGMRLGVLSDYPSRDKLAALGVDGFFGLVLCTTDGEINALKPHPRGFLRACEQWRLSPEEVLYVGDRSEVDAAGAVAAGVRCAVFARGQERGDAAGGPRRVSIRRCGDVDALVCAA